MQVEEVFSEKVCLSSWTSILKDIASLLSTTESRKKKDEPKFFEKHFLQFRNEIRLLEILTSHISLHVQHLRSILELTRELKDLFFASMERTASQNPSKFTRKNLPITKSNKSTWRSICENLYAYCKNRIKNFAEIEPPSVVPVLLELFEVICHEFIDSSDIKFLQSNKSLINKYNKNKAGAVIEKLMLDEFSANYETLLFKFISENTQDQVDEKQKKQVKKVIYFADSITQILTKCKAVNPHFQEKLQVNVALLATEYFSTRMTQDLSKFSENASQLIKGDVNKTFSSISDF